VLPADVAAALVQKSVHWAALDYELGGDHHTWIRADLNADSGRAWVTWDAEDTTYGGTYKLVCVNRMFYVRGDAESLRSLFGLTKAQTRRYVGRWISTPNGEGLTLGVADGLTLPSVVRKYGSDVYRTSARSIGVRLPVRFDKELSQVENISGTFSKWNETVKVTAPSRSTPIAIVRGG